MAALARRAANADVKARDLALAWSHDVAGLDRWIRTHFVYRPELEEIVRTPEFMLSELDTRGRLEGDCDDIATLYAAFLKSWDYPVRFVAIRYDPANLEFQHVFVEYWNGVTGWTRLDPTVMVGTIHEEIERMVEYV